MEQISVSNTAVQFKEDTVFISYSSSARVLALDVSKALSDCGIQYASDKKQLDADNTLTAVTKSAIENSAYYLLACTEACLENEWIQHEVAYAISVNKPILFYLENLNILPPGNALPALTTDNMARLAGYFAFSNPTQSEISLFTDTLLDDKTWSEKEFCCSQQGPTQVWRCKTDENDSQQASLKAPSLLISNEEKPECAHLVEISISNEQNRTGSLKLSYASAGSAPTEGYILRYEPRLRGVLVDPRKHCSLAIGIRSYNMEDGSEYFRAGTPTVDDQMFGRDLYGWHVSITFWKTALKFLNQKLSAK